jgi:hypothetical protein
LEGLDLNQVRTLRRRAGGGLVVEVSLFAKGARGGLASIYDPGNNRSVFQASYELRLGCDLGPYRPRNNVVAMAGINDKLFAATNDNQLWWRDPVK